MIRFLAIGMTVLACAGCATSSQDSTSTPPDSSAVAAKGKKIAGTGYLFKVPKGWGLLPQDIPGFDPDSVAFDLRDSDAFMDNVNVLLSPAGKVTPKQVEESAEDELAAAGVTNMSVNDRVLIAGGESAHVTAAMSMNGNKYTIEQFYPTRHDQTFIVTFSFSRDVPTEKRLQVADSTLATWTWTD